MLRKIIAGALVVNTSVAMAWEDIEYSAALISGAVYCTSQGNLEEFGAYAQDGDGLGADRMIANGECRLSNGMKANVFQENDFMACFMAPSGKVFYTFKQFLK